jgi:hypothetical protein
LVLNFFFQGIKISLFLHKKENYTAVKTFSLKHIPKGRYKLDLFFISLLLLFTLFDFNIFNKFINDRELLFVLIVSIWFVFKLWFHRIKEISFSLFDIGLLILFLFYNINFFILSNTTFYYSRYLVFVSYYFVFYLFKWSFQNDTKTLIKFKSILLLIVLLSIVQAIFSLIQFNGLMPVKNPYFKLLGSFSSPNYLALYLSFSVLILTWYLLIKESINSYKKIGIIISILLMGIVLLLSESRGTFLSLLFSMIVLFINYKKKYFKFYKDSAIQKGALFVVIITILFFAFKYLYHSDVSSIKGRKFIAKITTKDIVKNPLKGYGAFNFTGTYNKSKSDYFLAKNRSWEEVKVGNYVFSPLNDYLLIVYEFGIPFLLLSLFIIIILFLKVKFTNKSIIGFVLLLNIFIWSLFNTATINVPVMIVGIFGLSTLMVYGELRVKICKCHKYLGKFLVIGFFFIAFLGLYIILNKVTSAIKIKGYSEKTTKTFDKSNFINQYKFLENNNYIEFNIGYELYRRGYIEEGFNFMEESYKKTHHPKIGKSLASLYIRKNNYKRTEEIYRINMGIEPFRFEHIMKLISLMERTGNFKELIFLSQKVIDLKAKVPSETVDKYKAAARKNIRIYSKFIKSSKNQ